MSSDLISARNSIVASINKKVNTMNYFSSIVYDKAMNITANMPEEIEYDSYKEDFDDLIAYKKSLDNSLSNINNMIDKLNKDGYTQKTIDLIKNKKKLLLAINKADKNGYLSKLVAKGFTEEFMSSNGLMKNAKTLINDMNEMSILLGTNLQKYNANPEAFGANFEFWDDTGKFDIYPASELSRVMFYSSQGNYARFIKKFVQKYNELEKAELIDEKTKRSILEMKENLLNTKAQLDVDIEAYEQRVDELKSQIPMNIVEDINNKTVENLASMMAEKQEQDVVSSIGNARHSDVTHLAVMPVEMSV